MSERPDIDAAAARMGMKLGARRELRALPTHLWEGEQVQHLTAGRYNNIQGLVALTDRRLLFLAEGYIKHSTEDFPLDRITSVQWSTGLALGTLAVYTGGAKAEIKSVEKSVGKAMADALRARISGAVLPPPSPSSTPTASNSPASPDPYEQLRKLGELRDAGVLTPEEFERKKREILDRL